MYLLRFHKWYCCIGVAGLLLTSVPGRADSPAPGTTIGISIESFRNLLALKPAERKQALVNYSEERREAVLKQLEQYDILPPPLRDTRLHYTEVSWHLQNLMRTPKANRGLKLANIPDADRPLVEQRLKLWDGWPADIQKLFLENDAAMNLLLQGDISTPASKFPKAKELANWQSLNEIQRQEMYKQFRQFFSLKEADKQRTLNFLPKSDRLALQGMEKLAPEEREKQLKAFQKFNAMTPEEQARFLQTAKRWQAMSEQEREAWRNVVTKLPPMPPMPPGLTTNLPSIPMPPLPPMPPPLPPPLPKE